MKRTRLHRCSVIVDFNNVRSMRRAEASKARLENLGYKMVSERVKGVNSAVLVYEKVKK